MMYLLYPLDGEVAGYPRKKFEEDIVNECEKDIRSCFASGADTQSPLVRLKSNAERTISIASSVTQKKRGAARNSSSLPQKRLFSG
jgi:hypothetical protein